MDEREKDLDTLCIVLEWNEDVDLRDSRKYHSSKTSLSSPLSKDKSTRLPLIPLTLHFLFKSNFLFVMNWCDSMSHAVDLLESWAIHGESTSVWIRKDTTLDQECALKETVQICTGCMVVSILTTCTNFNTPPLMHITTAPLEARFAIQTRKYHSRKHVLQLILVCKTQSVQVLVNYMLTFPECWRDYHVIGL